jgi:signal transduction histidine kinase
MEERVTHLGGNFQLHSEPGHGTGLRIEIPLSESAMEAIA